MERDNFRKRYFLARREGCQRWQSLQDRVRQFMPSKFLITFVSSFAQAPWKSKATHKNDTFELLRANKPILVRIKVFERLPKTFALQPFHELREFMVC